MLAVSPTSGSTLIDVPHGLRRRYLERGPRRAADRGMRKGGSPALVGLAERIRLWTAEERGQKLAPAEG